MRIVRGLGCAGCLTLLVVYVVVGSFVGALIGMHTLATAVIANVAGLLGVVAYLTFWRLRYRYIERRYLDELPILPEDED